MNIYEYVCCLRMLVIGYWSWVYGAVFMVFFPLYVYKLYHPGPYLYLTITTSDVLDLRSIIEWRYCHSIIYQKYTLGRNIGLKL